VKSESEIGPVTVLYVEDEESDAIFMQEAFKLAAPEVRLTIAADGQQALDYLAGRDGYSQRAEHPVPVLVLLDLKLPVLPGFEVLRWMREQPQYKSLPVVVFSSSSREQDKLRSDELGADWYLEKPASAKEFRGLVEEVKRRWLSPNAGAAAGKGNTAEPGIRMRKLVQNKATKAFLTESGEWTKDLRSAKVFPTTEEARSAVLDHKLKNVELYYLFSEEVSRYDFTISLM
jgi:DNA-binding response OmpR family regulator